MRRRFIENFSFLLPAVLYVISFVILYFYILSTNNGIFTYPLDDSYIHLTLAKNFASTGILGINPGEFAFLTSSPLWTALLMIFKLIGINSVLLPLILNAIIGLILILILDFEFRKLKFHIIPRIVIIIIYFAFIPGLVLTFIGMEHFLHLLLSLIFIINFRKFFEYNEIKYDLMVSILAALLMLIRYESIFILTPLIILCLLKKKFTKVIMLVLFSVIPIMIIGFYSKNNGWFFLPTSLMLKGSQLDNASINEVIKFLVYFPLKKLYLNAGITSVISGLIILAYVQFINRNNRHGIDYFLTISILSTILLHLVLAQLGWFYR